jgi:plastocyanin
MTHTFPQSLPTLLRLTAIGALVSLTQFATAGNLTVVVTDKDGRPVQDAVVVIVPTNKSVLPKVPLTQDATVNQEKMQFIPSVSLVGVGAKIRLVNNDPWNHHVKSSPAGINQFNTTKVGFEMLLEGKAEGKTAKPVEVLLDSPGVVTANVLGCYIHGSMRGFMFVSDSPWAAKTGQNGAASFEDLPDGAAQIKVWQADQLIDLPPQSVQINATPTASSFQLTVNPRRRRT